MASGAPLNFAAAAQKEKVKVPLRFVQLEGQVVLKIAKHCKEQGGANTVVTGQLLGLDVGQTLEVTDCFPFPVQRPPRPPSPAPAWLISAGIDAIRCSPPLLSPVPDPPLNSTSSSSCCCFGCRSASP